MLETVREFGLERLEASGECDAVRDRHAEWYLALADQADPHLLMPGQEPWLEQVEVEYPNLRAVEEWLHAVGANERVVCLAGALRWFWLVRGGVKEGVDWLERALSATKEGSAAAKARALTGLGFLAAMRDRDRRANDVLPEALEMARIAGDPWETGWALHGLGIAAGLRGDYDQAEEHYEAALAVFSRLAEVLPAARARIIAVLADLAWVAFERGDLTLAAARSEEALAGERELGFTWLVGLIKINLGNVAWYRGDQGRAATCFREALAIGAAHHDQRIVAQALEGMAGLAAVRGDAGQSGRLVGVAATLREAIGAPVRLGRRSTLERTEATVRAAGNERVFQAARDEGWALPLERALAEALALGETVADTAGEPSQRQRAPAGLTVREYEVLRLIAVGRSNAEIAAALFISPRTATTHATHILNKLGLSSRAEVIAFAHREGLV
jgi:DNA-binding CsgD family transcriptional regulator/tetratricopeptide (TPR) repeat protein